EAVTWQNPAALVNAVVNVAENAPTKPSRARGREEIVASYWQRYCAKNDTIGFFGPLAWGRIADDGTALRARAWTDGAHRAAAGRPGGGGVEGGGGLGGHSTGSRRRATRPRRSGPC